MNIALFSDPAIAAQISARFESRGHACLASRGAIPGEADCVVAVGGVGDDEELLREAERAGLPVLRLPAESAAQAAEAAAWGLGLADERYIDAARSDGRVKRLEEARVKLAEQRALELGAANELLARRAVEVNDAMARLDRANRQLMNELNLASELQKSLLPRAYPLDAPLEFAHKFVPLNSIGGDFFDIARLDGSTIAMVIADVSGHGVGPALVTAMFKSAFVGLSKTTRSPAELMKALNADLNEFLTTGHYVTAFAAFIDLNSLEMRYCSAGHPNQLLVRAGGGVEELTTMGFLLGMIEGIEYEEKATGLAPGDTLVLYTDGVLEAADSQGRLFQREGIVRSIAGRSGAGPSELSAGLFSDLLAWTEGSEATDDVTILMAQVIETLY
jgi:sigma-B regulation protein RsbU (phosphoserine phosphatase)